jgi:hypothetical protein
MVDRDQRLAGRQRQPLGRDQPDHHAADQARPGRRGDRVDLARRTPASASTSSTSRGRISTWARAAISGTTPPNGRCAASCPASRCARMRPVGRDQSRRGLVAARFDAEDQAHAGGAMDRSSLPPREPLAQAPHDQPAPHRHPRLAARARPGAHGRRRAARRAWLGPGADRDRADHHHRRRRPGPAARRDRRQGLWTKELDRCAARRAHRHFGPFDEGRGDDPPARARDRRDAAARRRARPADRAESIDALPHWRAGRHLLAAPQGAAARPPAGPQHRPIRGNVADPASQAGLGEADATLLAAAGSTGSAWARSGAPRS